MKSALSRRGPRALRRGHTPRGFPSGTSGSGCLLFRCHAGPPRQLPGGRLSARRGGGGSPGLASRRAPPGPGCKPAPGFLPQTETQVSRRRCAEAAGCGSRARTANLHRHPGSFSSSREDLKKTQKIKKKKKLLLAFLAGFLSRRTACCHLQAPDPGGSAPRPARVLRAGGRMPAGFPGRRQPGPSLPGRLIRAGTTEAPERA